MGDRKRVLILIVLMAVSSIIVAGVTITVLYRTSIEEQQARLVETAQSQARLIEAVARFDKQYIEDYPAGPENATLSQIIDAHEHYRGFGKTGEFTLSKRQGDEIVFLLSHRHFDLDQPRPVPFNSELAEPMRRAAIESTPSKREATSFASTRRTIPAIWPPGGAIRGGRKVPRLCNSTSSCTGAG